MRRGFSDRSAWNGCYMPGSYVAFLEDPDVAHARQMNQRARIQLRKLVCRINACQPLDPVRVGPLDRFMSMAANPFFYRFIIGNPGLCLLFHDSQLNEKLRPPD